MADQVLEFGFIVLDPLVDGFSGVLVEVRRETDETRSEAYGLPYERDLHGKSPHEGDLHVLELTAAATGDRLLRFTSGDEDLVRRFFETIMAGEDPAVFG